MQQPSKDAFAGKVYVLQDGKLYSVSSEFAAIAKDHKIAVFLEMKMEELLMVIVVALLRW